LDRKRSVNILKKRRRFKVKGTIKDLQQKYAEHCGYKDFEELKEKNEEALRIWYLKMLEPEEEVK